MPKVLQASFPFSLRTELSISCHVSVRDGVVSVEYEVVFTSLVSV